MAGIEEYLNKIKNAVYGREVRQAIHDGIETCYKDGKVGAVDLVARERISNLAHLEDGSTTGDAEIIDARSINGTTYTSLHDAIEEPLFGGVIKNYIEDKNLDSTTGELVDETGTCVSEFVPYTWTGTASYDCGDNTKITYRIEFYDANKNHLSGFRNPSSTGSVTYRGINAETQVTGTVGYVRFSFKKNTTGKIFTGSQTLWKTAETPQKGVVQTIGDLGELDTENKDNLVGAINSSINEFFYISPNIADPSDFVVGEYVNQVYGTFETNSNYSRTGYVPVSGGKTYCIVNPDDFNLGIRYAFYDSTKEFLTGALVNLDDIGSLITAPANASFLVVSGNTTRFPVMVAKSDSKIPYADYGAGYLRPQFLPSEDLSDLIINLPSRIYAVVGIETNIYYENIVENWEEYNFNATCSKGKDMKRGFAITPTSNDVGEYSLSIVISTKDGKSSRTVSTTLIVASASAGSGQTTSLLVLGDSTTANGTAIAKLHENFNGDPMSIVTVGTLGTAPNNMEGRGGWTFEFYNTLEERNGVTNPFFNPTTQKFDANYYFTNTGITKPNWFFINLGINDMFEYVSDSSLEAQMQRCVDWCDAMITSIKSASATTKIGICLTIPPNDSQDAFGKAYGCGQTRNRYKRNNVIWVNRLIDEYENRTSEKIYLVPIYTNLDTVYNMGLETLPVNARNSITYESPIGNGGVHPVESGYWQIADVYTAFLKAQA